MNPFVACRAFNRIASCAGTARPTRIALPLTVRLSELHDDEWHTQTSSRGPYIGLAVWYGVLSSSFGLVLAYLLDYLWSIHCTLLYSVITPNIQQCAWTVAQWANMKTSRSTFDVCFACRLPLLQCQLFKLGVDETDNISNVSHNQRGCCGTEDNLPVVVWCLLCWHVSRQLRPTPTKTNATQLT